MRTALRLICTGAAAIAVSALAAAPAAASPPTHPHLVFVSTDNLQGNQVAVYDRGQNGALTWRAAYDTGGLGGQLTGSVVDHTASQGALAYDAAHQLVLVTNAGSNTISVFLNRGSHLRLRQVLPSGGTFPVSIAVHGNLVYVLDARDGAAIQGYVIDDGRLIRVGRWNRALNLPTGTPEFVNTPGQVAFSPDGRQLLVTTKATTSSIEVFGVSLHGTPAQTPVVTADAGAVPFAVAWDSGGHALIAEAGTNSVAAFTLHRNGRLTLVSRFATDKAATCWITAVGTHAYLSNAGSADVSIVRDPGTGHVSGQGNASTSAGTVDSAAAPDGRNLYVQGGAGGTVDAFRLMANGSLAPIGTVTVPNAMGGEGIAAS